MKLEAHLFCLYLSQLITVTIITLSFYLLLFVQVKSIINHQEDTIYINQQTSKKQILLGLKAHLDESFSLQSHEYYALTQFITKTYQSQVTLNSNHFIPPILNLNRLITNEENPDLIALYNRNANLTSVWTNDPIVQLDQLPTKTQDEFNKGAAFEVLIRSYNLLNVNRTFQYHHQMFGFSSSGLVIINPSFNNSIASSFQAQSVCNDTLYYDARCRTWYAQTILSTGTLMIPPYTVQATHVPYMSMSLCRRSDLYDVTTTVACQSLDIEQIASVFEKLETQTGRFHVIHPSSGDLLYSKLITDYQQHYSWKTEMVANMTDSESTYFLTRMDAVLSEFSTAQGTTGMSKAEYTSRYRVENVNGFEYEEQSNQKYCLLLPIQISDKRINQTQTTFTNVIVLVYVFDKGEMVQAFTNVKSYMASIFIANSAIYIIMLIVCLLIIIYYSKQFTTLIYNPISNLIDKINFMNEDFFEQKQSTSAINDRSAGKAFYHSCRELKLLSNYITSIQEALNYNLNYAQPIDETSSMFVCVNAIKRFERDEDAKALGVALNNLANIHFNNSRNLSALECYSHSLVCLQQQRVETMARANATANHQHSLRNGRESKSAWQIDQQLKPKQKQQRLMSSTQQIFLKLLRQEKLFLSPLLDRYFPQPASLTATSLDEERSKDLQNLQSEMQSLESLRFDRQFSYAQVLLSCHLRKCIDVRGQSSRTFHQGSNIYLQILGKMLKKKQEQCNYDNNNQITHLQLQQQSPSSNNDLGILHEYEQVLKKLLVISSGLSNDPTRSILLYLEISKLLLLKGEVHPADEYFCLAQKCFLQFFKHFQQASTQLSRTQIHTNPFLSSLSTRLQLNSCTDTLDVTPVQLKQSKRFNQDKNHHQFQPPQLKSFTRSGFHQRSNQKLTSTTSLTSEISSPTLTLDIPSNTLAGHSANMTRNLIQPILEEELDSQECCSQMSPLKNIITQQQLSQPICLTIAELPLRTNHNNSVVNVSNKQITSTLSSASNLLNSPSLLSPNTSSFFLLQQQSRSAFFSQPISFTTTEKLTTTTLDYFSIESHPSSIPESQQTQQQPLSKNPFLPNINYHHLSLPAIISQLEAIESHASEVSSIPWTQKTSFAYPIDILHTKLQIHEAVMKIVKVLDNSNISVAQTMSTIASSAINLTEAFEISPRYLASDRVQLLNLLDYSFSLLSMDSSLIHKQLLKFNNVKINISIILNSPDITRSNHLPGQLHDIYQLCNSFSVLSVNEDVDQYIPYVKSDSMHSQSIFEATLSKFLRNSTVQSTQTNYLSALSRASQKYIEHEKRSLFPRQSISNEPYKLTYNYFLIFNNDDRMLDTSTDFFYKLSKISVKILIFDCAQNNASSSSNAFPHSRKYNPVHNINYHKSTITTNHNVVKIRRFCTFVDLNTYLKRKAITCTTTPPFLVEQI